MTTDEEYRWPVGNRQELLITPHGTITEKSAVTLSLGGDNLKRYFDQK